MIFEVGVHSHLITIAPILLKFRTHFLHM